MERTQVAPDLRLELFAAEPDIAKPIAMAWDERGRCWVAETSDYPHGVTTWPNSQATVDRNCAGIDPSVKRKLNRENAAKLYRLVD
jgi:hypothetical protein